MGSINDFDRFTEVDNLVQDWLIPYAYASGAIPVGVGDLCYYKGDVAGVNSVAYPADQLASLGSEGPDQAQFARLFCGVSQEQVLSTEVNSFKKFAVRTLGVYDFNCPSQTFARGASVGAYSNGTTYDPQQVDSLQPGGIAIGMTVKEYLANTTRVRVMLIARYAGELAPGGIEPPSMGTQFGGSLYSALNGYFNEEGNLYRNVGNPIAGNGADTTDDILGGIVLPAGAFDIANRGLCITAAGTTGGTTNNKRFKVWLNPTIASATTTNGVISGGTVSGVGSGALLADSGAWVNGTTPNNAAGWQAMVQLFKYGAAGSNTQWAQAQNILGTLHGGISAAVFPAQPENAVMNIVVTGSSYTTGAANDVKLQFFEINAMN